MASLNSHPVRSVLAGRERQREEKKEASVSEELQLLVNDVLVVKLEQTAQRSTFHHCNTRGGGEKRKAICYFSGRMKSKTERHTLTEEEEKDGECINYAIGIKLNGRKRKGGKTLATDSITLEESARAY